MHTSIFIRIPSTHPPVMNATTIRSRRPKGSPAWFNAYGKPGPKAHVNMVYILYITAAGIFSGETLQHKGYRLAQSAAFLNSEVSKMFC